MQEISSLLFLDSASSIRCLAAAWESLMPLMESAASWLDITCRNAGNMNERWNVILQCRLKNVCRYIWLEIRTWKDDEKKFLDGLDLITPSTARRLLKWQTQHHHLLAPLLYQALSSDASSSSCLQMLWPLPAVHQLEGHRLWEHV